MSDDITFKLVLRPEFRGGYVHVTVETRYGSDFSSRVTEFDIPSIACSRRLLREIGELYRAEYDILIDKFIERVEKYVFL